LDLDVSGCGDELKRPTVSRWKRRHPEDHPVDLDGSWDETYFDVEGRLLTVVALADETRGRVERIVAAAEASFVRLTGVAEVIDADTPDDIFGPLGEAVLWIVALDDTLRKSLGLDYESTRKDDPNGRLIQGLQHARNKITHGLDVTTTSELYGGAMLGRLKLGTGRLNELPEHRWKAELPPSSRDNDQQKQPYADHLAGQGVLPTIRAALDYLRRVVEETDGSG